MSQEIEDAIKAHYREIAARGGRSKSPAKVAAAAASARRMTVERMALREIRALGWEASSDGGQKWAYNDGSTPLRGSWSEVLGDIKNLTGTNPAQQNHDL